MISKFSKWEILSARLKGGLLYWLMTLFVLVIYIQNLSPLQRLEYWMEDKIRSSQPLQPDKNNIAIVAIDARSITEVGKWPWNHSRLSDLLLTICDYRPKAVLVDIPLTERVKEYVRGRSGELAQSMGDCGNVILPFDIVVSGGSQLSKPAPEYLNTFSSLPPADMNAAKLPRAIAGFNPPKMFTSKARGVGFNYHEPDMDDEIRSACMMINYGDRVFFSSALQLANAYLGHSPTDIQLTPSGNIAVAGKILPTDDRGKLLVNLPKDPQPYPLISAIDILTGEANPSTIKDKAVIVAATDMINIEMVPTGTCGDIAVYNYHAAVIQNLISGNTPTRLDLPIPADLLLVLAIGVFGGFVLPRMPLLYRLIALFIVGFILVNINFVLFNSMNVVMSVLYPILAVLFFFPASFIVKTAEKKADATSTSKTFDIRKMLAGEPIAVQRDGEREINFDEIPSRILEEDRPTPEVFQETIRLDFEALSKGGDLIPASKSDKVKQSQTMREVEKPVNKEASSKTFIPDMMDLDMSKIPNMDNKKKGDKKSEKKSSVGDELILTPEEKKVYGVKFSTEGQPVSFGRYLVIEPLGMGAMGTVYKGKDPAIDRLVALKTIRLDTMADPSEMDELKERLLREAKAAGGLSHPNIVTIYDYGLQGNLQYIAMEYIEGYTLESVLKRNLQLNFRIVASVVMQVCSALEYAHKIGIIHRDIKPANIMVMDGFKVKVMDFGIAHFKSSSMTQTGVAMGTPNYISPEQLKGKEVTPSSDIFSLGVVLYELLTHKKPFTGENISTLVYKILNEDPPPPSSIDHKIPPLFDLILKKALAKNPMDRYRGAKDLAASLEDFTVTFGKKPTMV